MKKKHEFNPILSFVSEHLQLTSISFNTKNEKKSPPPHLRGVFSLGKLVFLRV